jgi:hypothetical protein
MAIINHKLNIRWFSFPHLPSGTETLHLSRTPHISFRRSSESLSPSCDITTHWICCSPLPEEIESLCRRRRLNPRKLANLIDIRNQLNQDD